jgi:hypothetical protein
MHVSPSELRGMSLWEFTAMVKGWNKQHTPSGATAAPLAPDVEEELGEFIDEPPIWMN